MPLFRRVFQARFIPLWITVLLFCVTSLAYFGWLLVNQPNMYFHQAYNTEVGDTYQTQLATHQSVGQTFAFPIERRLGGIAVRYIPHPNHDEVILHAALERDGHMLRSEASPLRTFTELPDHLFENTNPPVEAYKQASWIVLPFTAPPAAEYTLRLETADKDGPPLILPYEPASDAYPTGERLIDGQGAPGDLSFIVFTALSIPERLHRLLSSEQHLVTLLMLLCASLTAGVAAQVIRRARGNQPLLPPHPVLLFLLLAVLFTLPLYYDLRHWGAEDWPEVTAHFAAARHSLAAGEFPLWNPYFCGGFPAWGNPQTYWPSLTFLLTLAAGDIVGTKLAVTLYVALGLYGMSLLSKTFGLRQPAALLPPIIYMCSGFFAFHISAGHLLWLTMAWLPFAVHFFWRGLRRWHLPSLLLAALFYLLILLEGQIYFFLYTTLVLMALSAVGWLMSAPPKRHVAMLVLLFFLFSAGLGAAKIIPTWSFLQGTAGTLEDAAPLSFQQLPDVFLATPADIGDHDLSDSGWELLSYTGSLPLIAAALSLLSARYAGGRRRIIYFLFSAGLIALAVMMVPAQYNPLEKLPALQQLRTHQRAMLIVILSLSLLAGFGGQALHRRLPKRLYEVAIIAIALFVFFDLSQVAHTPFAAVFREPVLASESPPVFAMRSSRADTAYHEVLAGAGAPNYCPPHLRQWSLGTRVLTESDPDYEGEVASAFGTPVSLQSFSPNRLVIALGAVTETTDIIRVNQQYDRGWRIAGEPVEERAGRLAFTVTPAQSNTTITLQYAPRSVFAGVVISTLTGIAVAALIFRTRQRRSRGRLKE